MCPLNFHRGHTLCKGYLREFQAGLFELEPDDRREEVCNSRLDHVQRCTKESVGVRKHAETQDGWTFKPVPWPLLRGTDMRLLE